MLDADHAAFIQRGVSISIATCSRFNMPSTVRATGCRVSQDGSKVTVFVSATQGIQVLADIRDNGAIAVVFSEPSTHRAVQLKGKNASVSGIEDGDFRIVDTYRDAFVRELTPLGFDELLIYTLLSCPPADLVALSFTPCAAYSQTPGPKAGAPLGAGA
jgi:hypothetical protein